MSKKPSNYKHNLANLIFLCSEKGYECDFVDPDCQQMRVFAATHVIDIWPSRMTYHRVMGETMQAKEPYHHELNWQFDRREVEELLFTGELKTA